MSVFQFLTTTKNILRTIVWTENVFMRFFDSENKVADESKFYAFICRTGSSAPVDLSTVDCTLEHNLNLGRDIPSGF